MIQPISPASMPEASPSRMPLQNRLQQSGWWLRLFIGLAGLVVGTALVVSETWFRIFGSVIITLIVLSAFILLRTILRRFFVSHSFVLFDLVMFGVGLLGVAISVFLPTTALYDTWIIFSIVALFVLGHDLMRSHFRRSALALFVILILALIISGFFDLTKSISRPLYTAVHGVRQTHIAQGTVNEPLSDFAMISVTGVHRLSWNNEQKSYKVTTEALETPMTEEQFYAYRRMFSSDNALYVVFDDIIEKRSRAGSEVLQWKRPAKWGVDLTYSHSIGSVTFHNGVMYVSANGKFYVLNSDLHVLGEVDLNIGGSSTKNAHDILVTDDHAFLLDNFLEPVYIFTVDVRDPAQPRVMNRHGGFGLRTHLEEQWLDSRGNWTIVATETEYGGSSSEDRVMILPKDTYTMNLPASQFATWEKEYPIAKGSAIGGHKTSILGPNEQYGYSILRDDNHADGYFLVHDRKTQNVLLSKLDNDFQPIDPVTLGRFERVLVSSLLRAGDMLYITVNDQLYAVDVRGSLPVLLHSQVLQALMHDLVLLPEE